MADQVSNIRLGVSKQILPYNVTEVLEAEYNLSKFVVQSAQNTLLGLAVGTAASIFFKRKSIIFYTGGFGLGYTLFNTFNNCKCWLFITKIFIYLPHPNTLSPNPSLPHPFQRKTRLLHGTKCSDFYIFRLHEKHVIKTPPW